MADVDDIWPDSAATAGTTAYCAIYSSHNNNLIYTVSQKNDTYVAQYNFNVPRLILIIFGRDVAERVCYQMVMCYPTSPN